MSGKGTFGKLMEIQRQKNAQDRDSRHEPPSHHEPLRDEPLSLQSPVPVPGTPLSQYEPPPRDEPLRTGGDSYHAPPYATSRGYTRIPNTVLDSVLPTLDPYEQAVYFRLWRLTHGFRRDRCSVGHAALQEKTGIKLTKLRATIRQLERRGLVRIVSTGTATVASEYEVPNVWGGDAPDEPLRVTKPSRGEAMKDHETKELKAVAAAPDKFKIREKALRIREARRHVPGFELRAAVEGWLVGEGHQVDRSVVDDALQGIAG